jgi:hypothetical protein
MRRLTIGSVVIFLRTNPPALRAKTPTESRFLGGAA